MERAPGLDGGSTTDGAGELVEGRRRSLTGDEADRVYAVVVNDEEQYSIWPADREPPAGWRQVGARGSKDVCLAHIEEVWTDMRPLSLRRALEKYESTK